MEKKLNIYEKLIKVREACPGLKKDEQGKLMYKYVSSSAVLTALREAMDTHGLLLIPEVLSHDIREYETEKEDTYGKTKKGISYFTDLTLQYTWINCENTEEKIICQWCAQGVDTGEKGVGKALTYGEKYFLLKFFNIPTDKDDPDAHQKPIDRTVKPRVKLNLQPQVEPEPEKPKGQFISEAQIKKLHADCDKYNMTNDEKRFVLSEILGKPVEHAHEIEWRVIDKIYSTLEKEEGKVRVILKDFRDRKEGK